MNQQAPFAHNPPASGFLHFWTTLAGFLTATATLITAIAGLLIATGGLGSGSTNGPTAVISTPTNSTEPVISTSAFPGNSTTIAKPPGTVEALLIACDNGDFDACAQVAVIADAECIEGIVDSCAVRDYLVELGLA